MTRVAVWIATSGPAGYAPVAPGTFGSAVGFLIYFLIAGQPLLLQLVLTLAVTLVGVWASRIAAEHFDRKDPSHVVIDEVAGQMITLVGLGSSWVMLLLGFLVFRALDIIKPWPANRLESLPDGVGIMADDVMAAIYGQLVLRLALVLVPGMF